MKLDPPSGFTYAAYPDGSERSGNGIRYRNAQGDNRILLMAMAFIVVTLVVGAVLAIPAVSSRVEGPTAADHFLGASEFACTGGPMTLTVMPAALIAFEPEVVEWDGVVLEIEYRNPDGERVASTSTWVETTSWAPDTATTEIGVGRVLDDTARPGVISTCHATLLR